MTRKSARNVTIIGGADGPTSVFIAGKSKKLSLKERIRRVIYRRKRRKVEKSIIVNPHTLDEVIQYLQVKYGAVEISHDSHAYQEQRKSLKVSLIIRYKPELLGDMAEVKNFTGDDEKSWQEFWNQIKLQSKKAESVPDELLPMDFHVYAATIPGVGRIQFDIDTIWNIFGCGYSGSKKEMKRLECISKDVHLYYGVTEEDIKNKTDRYSSLVTTLCG